MAYVKARKNRSGDVTGYMVRWREGGSRAGAAQYEAFEDEPSAEVFRDAVNDAGQQWPPGWVKGQGYISADAALPDDDRYRFRAYAAASIEGRTGIEEHYRVACMRDLERWVFPTFGECDVRSVEHFSRDTIRAWVRVLEQAKVHKGQAPKSGEPKWRKMSPKTIRNLHGLLSSILQEAVTAEPPLRLRNPCEQTRLPRADDDGAEDGDDIEFLTPEEVEGVISCMKRRSDQLLATIKYGSGMRWSEVTALAPECLVGWTTDLPKVRVKRAWKRDGKKGYYLGTPKSKRGRRTLRVSASVMAAVEELGGKSEPADRLYFTGESGRRLHYSTFYDRWQRAVRLAKAEGLLPQEKAPTPHDLRHSHAAALISAGHSLTYVQRRLGHESIKTTSDTYGHLLPEADDAAMETIERSLGRERGSEAPAPVERVDRSRVHAVVLPGGKVLAFWESGVARAVVEQWTLDRGPGARVETWAVDWWIRQQGNGVQGVRGEAPQRVWVWSLGPALYGMDGTERTSAEDVHEPQGRWVWEWEEGATAEAATWRTEWVPGGAALTRAAASGVELDAVRAAYAEARAEALRLCAGHPDGVAV
ncbi:tyrosine-type recombinase/integrase [Streptomyces albidoflavus]